MKTVLITGASGFIGSALVRAFSEKGWRVVGAGRTQPPELPDGVEWRTYDLAWTSLPDDFLEGVDAVVHGAMMKQSADERSFDINVAAGKMLLDRAHQRDITRVAFLSSLAAHEGALSQYGKQKYVLERHFDQRGALVVRPGLVLGNGGLFASMRDYLRSHRYVPADRRRKSAAADDLHRRPHRNRHAGGRPRPARYVHRSRSETGSVSPLLRRTRLKTRRETGLRACPFWQQSDRSRQPAGSACDACGRRCKDSRGFAL